MKNKYSVNGQQVTIFMNRKDGGFIETIVDSSDFEKVNSFPNTWVAQYNRSTNSYYVVGSTGSRQERQKISLHRFITDTPKKYVTDHINHNTLDNRRENLRVVKQKENCQNRKGCNSNSKSGVRGVFYHVLSGRWQACIGVNKKRISLGYFDEKEKAIEVVRDARMKYMTNSSEVS